MGTLVPFHATPELTDGSLQYHGYESAGAAPLPSRLSVAESVVARRLEFFKSILCPNKYQVVPPNNNNLNTLVKECTVYGNFQQNGVNGSTAPSGALIWLPQLGFNSIHRYENLNPQSILQDLPAVGSPNTVLGWLNIQAQLNLSMFWPVAASADVSIQPGLTDSFSLGRAVSALIRVQSSATSTTSAAMSGTFSCGALNTTENVLDFSPPNLAQQSPCKRDGRTNVKCQEGIVSILGSDIPNAFSPLDWYGTAGNQNSGFTTLIDNVTSDIPISSVYQGDQAVGGMGYGPALTNPPTATNGVLPSIYAASASMLQASAWFSPSSSGRTFVTVSAAVGSNVRIPNYNAGAIGLENTLSFSCYCTATYVNPASQVATQVHRVGSVQFVHYYGQSTGNPPLATGTINNGQWTYITDVDIQTVTFAPPTALNYLGGQYIASVNNSGLQAGEQMYKVTSSPRPLANWLYCGTMITALGSYELQGTDLIGMQLNIVKVDTEANRQYQQGVMGPARIIRWDNVASGQSVIVTGSVVVEAVANGNLAPYVSGGTALTAIDANLLPFTAQLFNSPKESYFHRNYSGEQYNRMLTDFVANMTAQQVIDIATRTGLQGAEQYAQGLFADPLRAITDAGSSVAQGVGNFLSSITPSDAIHLAGMLLPYLADGELCSKSEVPRLVQESIRVIMPQIAEHAKDVAARGVKRSLAIMQSGESDSYSDARSWRPQSAREQFLTMFPDRRDNSYTPAPVHGAFAAEGDFASQGEMYGAQGEMYGAQGGMYADGDMVSDDEQEAQGTLRQPKTKTVGYDDSGVAIKHQFHPRNSKEKAGPDALHRALLSTSQQEERLNHPLSVPALRAIVRKAILIAIDRFHGEGQKNAMIKENKINKHGESFTVFHLQYIYSGRPCSFDAVVRQVWKNIMKSDIYVDSMDVQVGGKDRKIEVGGRFVTVIKGADGPSGYITKEMKERFTRCLSFSTRNKEMVASTRGSQHRDEVFQECPLYRTLNQLTGNKLQPFLDSFVAPASSKVTSELMTLLSTPTPVARKADLDTYTSADFAIAVPISHRAIQLRYYLQVAVMRKVAVTAQLSYHIPLAWQEWRKVRDTDYPAPFIDNIVADTASSVPSGLGHNLDEYQSKLQQVQAMTAKVKEAAATAQSDDTAAALELSQVAPLSKKQKTN